MKEIKTCRDLMKVLLDGHTVERKSMNGDKWNTVKALLLYASNLDDLLFCEYRIAPTKPSIDWSHVHPDFNCLATDKNGKTFLFKYKPSKIEGDIWSDDSAECVGVEGFSSFKEGNCDWTESLVERPEN